MAVGKRIFLKRNLPSKELLDAFGQIPAANVADVINRCNAMNQRIRLISSPKKPSFCGPALTVKARAGDNLLLHAAIDICAPGDVIVLSNEGASNRSLMGEIMFTLLEKQRRCAGIVIDGPIRDIDAASRMEMPIYATGSTPGGPYKEGPGEVNVPISCGEVPVRPGDLIIGDPDGIVVVPLRDASVILAEAQAYHDADRKKLENAVNGTSNRSWVQKALFEKGFEMIDDVYRD